MAVSLSGGELSENNKKRNEYKRGLDRKGNNKDKRNRKNSNNCKLKILLKY